MTVTLRYAGVVDRDQLQAHGGLAPSTDNKVLLSGQEPGVARDFVVIRAWDDVGSGFEEGWRLEDPHGQVVYTGTPRTVLAEDGEVHDEVQGVRFDYADTGFQLVFDVDGEEAARARFDVAVASEGTPTSAT